MRTIKIRKHSVLGLLSIKYVFESSDTAIVDTWSPLKELSVGNYTIEMKDITTTQIELMLSNSERERQIEEEIGKWHFLVLNAYLPQIVENSVQKLPLEDVRSITEYADGHYIIEYFSKHFTELQMFSAHHFIFM
jgi:hypothetical protein